MDYCTDVSFARTSRLASFILPVVVACGPTSPTESGGNDSSSGAASGSSTGAGMTTPPSMTADTTIGPPSVDTDTLGGTTSPGPPLPTTGTTEDSGTTEGMATTEDSGTSEGSSGGSESGVMGLPDFSGEYLLAVETIVDPGHPFQYIATFDFTPAGMAGSVDVELLPLTLDVASTTMPRLPFPPPLTFLGLPVAADGSFTVDVGPLFIAGPTNPITAADVVADMISMELQVLDMDNVCGTFDGAIVQPIMLQLTGSTVGAVRVADTTPAGLPVNFPTACP
ncbi:MAG: hypothetical protein K0V04_12570 [Deltaproteobacteria bacterium]|nr:hypothetical protein [Deltaproteobacteria bacterium]